MEIVPLRHSTPASWLHTHTHTPVWVGEVHSQQDALLFIAKGGDNDQIPDSDGADGLQLHRLHDRAQKTRETKGGGGDFICNIYCSFPFRY